MVDLCSLFFEQLPPPICLLAHNGHKYDFPLLAAELLRVGRHLSEHILCADTLDGFRDILSLSEVQEELRRANERAQATPDPVANRPDGFVPRPSKQRPMQAQVRRRLQLKEEDVDRPSNVTPEMQVVKANVNFGNAPKKKPLVTEVPKAVRVSTAKRKLEFGPSASEVAKNLVDDVDREDVMDSIHGFHLVSQDAKIEKSSSQKQPQSLGFDPALYDDDFEELTPMPSDSSTGQSDSQSVSGEQKDGAKVEKQSSSSWEKYTPKDDIPDHLLIEAVDQFEGMTKSKALSNGASTSGSPKQGRSWASVVQGSKDQKDNKPQASIPSPQPSCSKDGQGEVLLSPVTSAKPNSEANQKTPPTNGAEPLDSFPTPSPSPHKQAEMDDCVSRSVLSPLAAPFVPASMSRCHRRHRSPSPFNQTRHPTNPLGFSLALSSLHKRVLGYEPPDAHRAEDDCMSLVRLSNKLTPWFCDWVDQHATAFCATAPMYKSAKRPKKP